MDIDTARGVAARIWCDHEMGKITMDVELAENIAQLLVSRLPSAASDTTYYCSCDVQAWADNIFCNVCGLPKLPETVHDKSTP